MRKFLKNYEHRIGSHCGSTLMSNILHYYGYPYDEDLCFGIGSGLGFLYRKSWSPPFYMILGRSHDIEDKISQHLGFFASTNITCNNHDAWVDVKRMIDNDIPVLVDLDAAVVPYIREKFNLFEHVRYGGHRACLVGYDEEKRTVILSDYAWVDLQEVDFDIFAQARSSDISEFPSRNLWFRFYFPDKLIPVEEAIIRGIGFNIHTMLYPTTRQTGLMGLEKFVRQVRYWHMESNEQHVMKNAYITYMMLETVGTGGGNFRRIYARFLKKAGDILKDKDLGALSESYFELAGEWKTIAYMLLESSKNIKKGIFEPENNVIQERLHKIYEKEYSSIIKMKEIVETRYSWVGYKFLEKKDEQN